MSDLDGYKPLAIIRNSIDKLESQGLLTLDLQSDPESNRIDRTLVFRGVRDFQETVYKNEDTTDYLESIIGLDEYSTKYVLTTDIREIVFSSFIAPEIVEKKQ
jgi:hypothetical protein